jgi:hypothetical protein
VLQLLFAAVVEYPFECSLLEVGEGRATRTAIPLHDAPHRRDPVLAPALERWEFDGGWHPDGLVTTRGSAGTGARRSVTA